MEKIQKQISLILKQNQHDTTLCVSKLDILRT